MNDFDYQKELNNKLYKGIKLTPNEKQWLATHPLYREKSDSTILVRDIITIEPNRNYHVNVVYESCSEDFKFTPTIAIPMSRGEIRTADTVYGFSNNSPSKDKRIYMLSTCNNPIHPISNLTVFSELGCFQVLYHIKTMDHRGTEYWASSTVMLPLGMRKETISENSCKYFCNSMENGNFSSYTFSVFWEEKTE